MFIQFLGTGAGSPNLNRNVSGIALIFNLVNYDVWLFDCGESTQNQILHTSIKLSKISKIFITHLHGDHIFGLPGLLTTRSMNSSNNSLTIYGGQGIKSFVYHSLKISNSFISFPLNIIEIKEGEIFNNNKIIVKSFLLNHNIECYGFRVEILDRIGHLNVKKLVKDNIFPGPIYKLLKMGKKVFVNGKYINGNKYLGCPIKGKNIIILGDTAPFKVPKNIFLNIDVLVHESTLDATMMDKANKRGHSTNIQAANIAKQFNVKKLIITHFSARYNNKELVDILKQCRNIFRNTQIANDFSKFKI